MRARNGRNTVRDRSASRGWRVCRKDRNASTASTWPLRSSRCCMKNRRSSAGGMFQRRRSCSRRMAKARSATHRGGWESTAGSRVSTRPSRFHRRPRRYSRVNTRVASRSSLMRAFFCSSWPSSFLAGSPPLSTRMPPMQRSSTEVRAREKPYGWAWARLTDGSAWNEKAPSSKSARASVTRSGTCHSAPSGRINPSPDSTSCSSARGCSPFSARRLRACRGRAPRSRRVLVRCLLSSRWKTMVFSSRTRPSGPSCHCWGRGSLRLTQIWRSCSSLQLANSW